MSKCALALAGMLTLCGPVFAAGPQRKLEELDRIQVTATRTPHAAQDVPASISVVEGPDYRTDTLGASLSEKLATIPGLLARNRHNYAQDEQLSIRGSGTRASFGIRGVRLYVDGIPATMPDGQGQVSHFPLATAERIEVLRGPFSALYGNASGGVIQLFTADGTAPTNIGIASAGGSDDSRRLGVDLRGAQADRFDYSLGLNHFATDGFRDHSRAERTAFNGKANLSRGNTTVTLLANALSAPGTLDPLGLSRVQFEADPRQATEGAHLFNTRKSVSQRQLGAVLAHDFTSDAQLRLLAYAGEREVTQFLAIPVATQRNPLSGGGVIDLRAPYAGLDARWTQTATLAGKPLEVVVGLGYDQLRQDRRGYENFVGSQLGVRGALRLQQDDRVAALDQYAQATWRPDEAWSLMAGVRRSEIAFRSRDRYITTANPDDSGRVTYRATSPVFGLGWQPRPSLHVYASYGHGFETPTFNELGYRADGGSGLNFGLRPARTRSGEVGMKLQDDAGLRTEVVLFRADTRDELTVNTSSGGRTTFQNAGDARRFGAEWSASLPLAGAWRALFAYTHVNARFRDGFLTCVTTPCAQATIVVAPDTRIPGVPRNTLYAALHWGDEIGWHVRFDGQYGGAVPVNNLDDERADAYAVFGASAGYGFRDARSEGRVFFAVGNAFDRRYAGSVIVNEGNRRYYEPAPGRKATVGIEWRWRD
ncbi:TonB-dependent receptor [Lysobacter sp. CFH 32150]|uniref:TonB-dependent receptor family protein n=1 Tax=Lysobacter sp. CFH 32150 TaxID=2927128 RepID=UPI001FA709DB|nr:TonB-dependent receptor [Lysobacter sp. CFH 32150]MCI4568417.1 TonB-dependent receptor [Lysobacter sp. CFH 32150]